MKRLTIKTPNGAALEMNNTYPNENAAREDLMKRYRIAIDRLAAYEDTGLGPEEIEVLQAHVDELTELFVNTSCGGAVPYTRLSELAQAEKDGRLVVLPKGMVSMIMVAFVDEGDKDMLTPLTEARGEEAHVFGMLSYLADMVAKYNHTDYVSLLKVLIENPIV